MNLVRPKVTRQAWDLMRTRVGRPAEQEPLERIPLAKNSPASTSGDPQGRNARPSQARGAMDGEEQALCMGNDRLPTPADSSHTEGARGYAPSL